MALQWWEFYEIAHKARNLKKEIAQLREEIKHLREEVEKLKQQKKSFRGRSFWGRFTQS